MKTCIFKFDHLSNLLLRRPESYIVLMSIHKIDYKCSKKNIYTAFLKLQLYIIKTYSHKFILDCNASWIYKRKTKQQSKITMS